MNALRREQKPILRLEGLRFQIEPEGRLEADGAKQRADIRLRRGMIVRQQGQMTAAQMPCPAIANIQDCGDSAQEDCGGKSRHSRE